MRVASLRNGFRLPNVPATVPSNQGPARLSGLLSSIRQTLIILNRYPPPSDLLRAVGEY